MSDEKINNLFCFEFISSNGYEDHRKIIPYREFTIKEFVNQVLQTDHRGLISIKKHLDFKISFCEGCIVSDDLGSVLWNCTVTGGRAVFDCSGSNYMLELAELDNNDYREENRIYEEMNQQYQEEMTDEKFIELLRKIATYCALRKNCIGCKFHHIEEGQYVNCKFRKLARELSAAPFSWYMDEIERIIRL